MDLVVALEVLALASLIAAIASLFWRGSRNQSFVRKSRLEAFDLDAEIATVQVDPSGPVLVSEAAAAILGAKHGLAKTIEEPFEQISVDREQFEGTLHRLLSLGTSMQTLVHLSDGKIVEVTGRAIGRNILLKLDDQTALRNRVSEAERVLEETKATCDLVELAHRHGGVIAWQVDHHKAPIWQDQSFEALPKVVRARLLAVSEASHDARRLVIDVQDQKQAVFDMRCIDHDRLVFVAIDATQARASEQSMDRLIYTMSETFAHLRVGLMIFDAERRLSLFNPAIGDIFGDDTDWMTQRPLLRDLLDRLRAARKLPEQVDYKAWRAHILTMVDEENLAPFEEHWHLPDGRGLKVLFRPHPSGGLAMIVEDVTEALHLRRTNEAERAVRIATTDLLEEGIVVLGTDGKLKTANAAVEAMWKIPAELTKAGVHVSEFLKPCIALTGNTPFWERVGSSATQCNPRGTDQARLALTDGRFVSARLSPMPDGSSLLVFSDVTASQQVAAVLRQRNETLEHADEMRAMLIDQISYQMRTPLNSISGFGQLMSEERFGALTEVQREYVNGIISCSDELLEAINNMADLISVDDEDDMTDRKVSYPKDAVMEVIRASERPFQSRNRTVEVAADSKILAYAGSQARLRQIVFNLLNDALPNMPDDCEAELALRATGTALIITCTHRTRGQDADPGVALALVRRFVRLEDGRLDVHLDEAGTRILQVELAMRGQTEEASSDVYEWAFSPLAKAAHSG